MTVSLLEVLAAARAHAAPLAAESAGYLLLAVADHVAALPQAVSAEDVELMQDGSVQLRARRAAVAPEAELEQGVRALLARVLEVSSSVGPALRRASERRDTVGSTALVRELENALIPVNRSAAKRALSRLHREVERARDAGKLQAALGHERSREAAPVPSREAAEVPSRAAAQRVAVEAPPPAVESVLAAADFPEPSPLPLPVVVAAPPAPRAAAVVPPPLLTLTPEPQIAVAEPVLTKPEPVVLRNRQRGSNTPQLGTVITALTLPGEEPELTERAPNVEELELAEAGEELDIDVDVELESDAERPNERVLGPLPALLPDDEVVTGLASVATQPLLDPEPSRMPDVVLAMVELHTGMDADDAPTRLRDVVTVVDPTPAPAPPVVEALTPSPAIALPVTPRFESERADPAVHEALTWNPGPVTSGAGDFATSVPASFTIAEPLPEPSPYAPAVLPARSSDVSELLDSFYVTGAAEEDELRSALKEMAGLTLTPMPVPLIEER